MVRPLDQSSKNFINRFLPYQSHFLEVNGYQLHYIDEGPRDTEKPAVILLHGNPTWSFYYRNLIEALRKEVRVIAPDYIGCGLSDHPADKHFRAIDRIESIQRLISTLGLKKYSLVMHDWGGSIGTGVAVRNIPAVDKLVYLNTTLTETESLPKIIKTAAKPYIGKFLTKYTMRFLKLTTTTGLGVSKKMPKEIKRGYYYPYRSSARRTAIWDFVQDIPFNNEHPSYAEMLNLAEKMPKLGHIPVQIVWGLRDPCFHREMLNKVAEHFPQANILEIPDASHLVLDDAPELSISTIKHFLLTGTGQGVQRENISLSKGETINPLYAALAQLAESMPHKDAAIEPSFLDSVRYTHTNYQAIWALVRKYERGLYQLGLRPNDKVLFLVPGGVEFLALTFAVMGRGAIPVFLDPGMGRENIFACIKAIKPDAFIGAPRAQLLRLKRKELFPNLKFHITASEWLYTGGPNLSFLKKFSSRPLASETGSDTSFIAFTSGATGVPKGVVFTPKMLERQLQDFRNVLGLEPGKKDLPLLGIFSLFNLALGVCSVFPPMNPAKPLDLEPDKIIKVINDLAIDYSFGSPTLWNKLAEYCQRSRSEVNSISRIFIAGAPVSAAVLARVKTLLTNGEVYTPYGATEALPVTLISASEILATKSRAAVTGEVGTLVGKTIPGVEARVIQASSQNIASMRHAIELKPYQIGEIVVRGANVSTRYFERPEADQAAKIADEQGSWHRMGDMGYVDDLGNLYFCGRKSHAFDYQGRHYYSIPAERIFNQHHKVKRSALVKLSPSGEPAIAIEPFPQHWPETNEAKRIFAEELLNLGKGDACTEKIDKVFFHPSFPVDARHNAKIFRDRLSIWASEHEAYERAA